MNSGRDNSLPRQSRRRRRLLEDLRGEELDHESEDAVGQEVEHRKHSSDIHKQEKGEDPAADQPHDDAVPRPSALSALTRQSQSPSLSCCRVADKPPGTLSMSASAWSHQVRVSLRRPTGKNSHGMLGPYSHLRVTTGSTRVARQAGSNPAMIPVNARIAA